MSQSRLRIELLGNVCIVHGDGHRVTLPSARRRALLAYLVLHRVETVDRERLAYLFWPDSEDGQARTNLRRELHHLRSEVPDADEIFDLGGTTLGWREGAPATTDVDEFFGALADAERLRTRGDWRRERRALERAAELYSGDLVPSCYEDWIEPHRQRLHAALTTALDRLSELCDAAGDPGAAVLHAERRVRLDPLDEAAYRRLMAVHQRQGNRAAAIHAFHRCAGMLERELGVAPSAATRASYESLLAAEGGSAQATGTEETRGATPLVGRAAAIATLAHAWELAKAEGPAVLVVSGEAGIGKTRLVEEFVRTVVPADTGPVSGRLAQHLELGGETARAVDAYRQAAREAAAVFSHEESLRLLEHALGLLHKAAPSQERDRRELELQLARIIPARSLGGYTAPLTEAAAERAAALAERLHDPGSLYHALRSLQTTRFVSGRLALSLELSERLQDLARHVPDRKAEGDHAMAGSLLTVGDLEGAIEHFERAERGYDPTIDRATTSVFGADLAVFTAAWQAHALWLAGLADRAGVSSVRAVRLADTLAHPYNRALAHAFAALFHHLRRDRRACRAHAREATEICERHGFAYYVHWGRLFGAWAATNRPGEDRVRGILGALEGLEREGAAVRMPIYLSVLGLTQVRAGRPDEARHTLARARACAEETGELWWTPEILRLQALLAESGEERLGCLRGALESALRLKARPLAARAATSLAGDLRSRNRPEEARAALASALEGSPSDAGGRDRRRAERCLERLSR